MSSLLNIILHGPDQFGKTFCSFSPSPPPPPDTIGAAKAQSQANIDAARVENKFNNPNVVSPYGTQTVTWEPTFDQAGYDKAMAEYQSKLNQVNGIGRPAARQLVTTWGGEPVAPTRGQFTTADQPTITQTLSPQQQALLDEGTKAKLSLSQLASRGAEAAGDVIGKNVDFSGIPDLPGNAEQTRQKVVDAMMQRVNEDYGRATDDRHSALIAAGIRPGTKAYDDQMQLLQRGLNDASTQAWLAGGQEMSRDFTTDMERRRAAISDYLTERQVPLNEVTALMSGSQVSNPFATPGYAQNAQIQPAPIFAAQNALTNYNTDLYNAQAASAGNTQAGLMGLGSTAILGGAMLF